MVKRYTFRNINFHIRKRTALIKELGKLEPFIRGSIVKIARVCGNKTCKCSKGEKHVSEYLTYRHKHKKRTSTIYIPLGMVEEVRKWAEQYKELKRITEDICEIQRKIIRQYVREKKRPKK